MQVGSELKKQSRQGGEQLVQRADLTGLTVSIATIATNVENLTNNFAEFKKDFKEETKRLTDKVDIVENRSIVTSERVGNLAIFQGVFSLVLSGIAGYLGIKK